MKSHLFLLFVISLMGCIYTINAAFFHEKMGGAYILTPEDFTLVGGAKLNQAFMTLLREYNQAVQDLETAELEGKEAHQKRVENLERLLIKQSLQDRRDSLASDESKTQIRVAKARNYFSPLDSVAAAERSGVLFAHEKGLLGTGAEIGIIEGVNDLPSDSFLKKRLNTSEQDRKLRSYEFHHAESVTSVILQVAPKAQVHLIDRIDVRAVAEDLSRTGKTSKVWFSEQPVIYNWSGSAALSQEAEEYLMPFYKFFFGRSPC